MAVLVVCPNPDCGASLSTSAENLGRRGRCKRCGQALILSNPGDGSLSALVFESKPVPGAGSIRSSLPSRPLPRSRAGFEDPPEQFGRYRITKKLGQGGMGAVYLAQDTQLDRQVALKIPHFTPEDGPEVLERFDREARVAATFDHPNLCPVYDVGQVDGIHFLTMPYIKGKPLSEIIDPERPIPQRQAAAVVRKLALALEEAHRLGVIHRDLKPANIMASKRRELVIMDFGLARTAGGDDSRLTRIGSILGTPSYMAPEQVAGDLAAMGPGCDIYSLGVILYEMLTGRTPFEGPAALVLGLIMVAEPEPPSRSRPDLDPRLEAICRKAMARKVEDRFRTMRELAAALDDYLLAADHPPESQPSNGSLVIYERAGVQDSRVPSPAATPDDRPASVRASASFPPKERGEESRRPPRLFLPALAAFAATVLLGGVVIYLATAKGMSKDEVNGPEVISRPGIPLVKAEESAGRLPVPDADLLDQTERQIREDFKRRLADGKLDDRPRLARELLGLGNAPVNQPQERFIRLRLASELAAEAGDYLTAIEACRSLGKWFDVDKIQIMASMLANYARFAETPKAQVELAEVCLATGFTAVARDDYRFTSDLAQVARTAAEKARADYLLGQLAFLDEEAAAGKGGFARVRRYAETLRTDPNDPRANLEVGLVLCLIKHDWEHGLPMLALGSDPALKALAGKELEAPTAPAAQVALGDLWWDLAGRAEGEPVRFQRRARHWYLKGLSHGPKTFGAPTVKRLHERMNLVPAREFRVRIRAQGLDYNDVRLSDDGLFSERNRYGHPNFMINQLRWDTRSEKELRNTGAMRFLPDDLDFTTAEVTDWRITGGTWENYGKLLLFAAEDHVLLRFVHWPSGSFDVDMTITFGRSVVGKDTAIAPEWDLKFHAWKPELADQPLYWAKLFDTEPLARLKTENINFCWDRDSPAKNVPAEHFATVATARVQLPEGDYKIRTFADDSIRLFIDDDRIIDHWVDQRAAGRIDTTVRMKAGDHAIRIEHAEKGAEAALTFSMRPL